MAVDGTISTCASGFLEPGPIAVDSAANLYVVDEGDNTVRKVAQGATTIIAGGGASYQDAVLATLSGFNSLAGVAVDAAGTVYVTDAGNSIVVALTPYSAPCTYAVQPAAFVATVGGGTESLSIQTGTACPWTVSGLPAWIEGPAGGTGPGTVTLAIAPDSAASRAATFSIGGARVSVSQNGAAEPALSIVSAASYQAGPVAPASLAALFGSGLASASISIHDAQGNDLTAEILYASDAQINFVVPPAAALGSGLLNIQTPGGLLSTSIEIAAISPGIFALNPSGLAAADALLIANGTRNYEPVFQLESGAIVPAPIDLGPPGTQVYLEIYGTGLRAAGTAGVVVTIGGIPSAVTYAGTQGVYPGADQIDVLVPRGLAGAGLVPIQVTAAGIAANQVLIAFQ